MKAVEISIKEISDLYYHGKTIERDDVKVRLSLACWFEWFGHLNYKR
jgi:hypothetical protein